MIQLEATDRSPDHCLPPHYHVEVSVWQEPKTNQYMAVRWNLDDGARLTYTGPAEGWINVSSVIVEEIDWQHPLN